MSSSGDGVNRGNDVDPDKPYAIGNKKPPLHTRFKPGQSGNPRGRPKGRSNLGTTLAKELNKMVSATINGKAKKVTKGEAFVLALVTDGITKGPQSKALLLNPIRQQEREAAEAVARKKTEAEEDPIFEWNEEEEKRLQELIKAFDATNEARPAQAASYQATTRIR